uniref:HAT C-terminal dimerisation domain-containing protein n=1 Tax=Brassica oleracea var. oleracea TaxID=109376 RepID=A0A0D3C1Z2_BRAOL
MAAYKKLNVLRYWRDNSARFKELATMAREVLSIPITTVASALVVESLTSTGTVFYLLMSKPWSVQETGDESVEKIEEKEEEDKEKDKEEESGELQKKEEESGDWRV